MPSRELSRILWVVFAVLIAVYGMKAWENVESVFAKVGKLDVSDGEEAGAVVLKWRGVIEAPMESKLAEAFQLNREKAPRFVLVLSSPGGSTSHGARVTRLLQSIKETHKLETRVGDNGICASMCVPVYLQGDQRSAGARARFMFHEVSFMDELSNAKSNVPERATVSATDQLFAKYFAPRGVSESWMKKVRAEMSGGREVWETASELADENAGIVLEVRE